MKKILILMTTIVIVIISIGCSKDHSAPTFGKYVQPKPSNVAAVYNSDDKTADVTWDMADVTDVIGYQLSVSDSSDFDLGHIYYVPAQLLKKQTIDVKDKDKPYYYIKVAAIFNNDTLNNYYGPASDNAATLVIGTESE